MTRRNRRVFDRPTILHRASHFKLHIKGARNVIRMNELPAVIFASLPEVAGKIDDDDDR